MAMCKHLGLHRAGDLQLASLALIIHILAGLSHSFPTEVLQEKLS